MPGGDPHLLQRRQLGSVTTFRHENESKVESHHFCLVRAWDIDWSIVAEPIRLTKQSDHIAMPDAKILHRGTAGHSYPELTSLESRGEGGSKIKVLSPVDRRVASIVHTVNMSEGGD